MLRRLIGEDIDLVLIRDSKLGKIRADEGQIEQILMNLAVNARDAMPTGGKLTIETANANLIERDVQRYPFLQAGTYVMLSVTDTGCGMTEETQSRVFEPFYTTKPVGQGTGLGLSTVYGIVKQSSGYILLDSELGKGARFRIFFRRLAAALEPKQTQKHTALPGGLETILVVEDEPALRELTRAFLESRRYSVLAARNYETAIATAREQSGPLHLLLTDVVLPGRSGRVLADQLKLFRPETKVLYMSGYTDDLISRNGILDPETTLLHKPFTIESLLKKVREVLDKDTQ